ncbi:MAG: response regulator [bacterium]
MEEQRILIVDDTPENIDILSNILKDYKKSIALNGEKALKVVQSKKPDLILLDVMMPEMDGFETCRRLKANPGTCDIPIIFITAKNSVEDETKGLELGAVDFIPKPISPPIVLARVKNHLELLHVRKKLEEQNKQLVERNKYITDSINYAKKIQTAILPSKELIDSIFNANLLIYKPKDIVSGDFCWIKNIDNYKIFSVVDCTGHGVPGSLMSMIGNTLLNEIINFKRILEPSEILNLLNEGIINELNKEKTDDNYDGMDLSMCVIEESTKTIKIASSFRPVFCFADSEFIEIKGNKKSIGDKRKNTLYTTQTVKYKSGITIYQFTDGFIDQQNAENVKFGLSRFRELLQQIQNLTLPEQKEKILSEMNLHIAGEEQRDDMTIMAIKL